MSPNTTNDAERQRLLGILTPLIPQHSRGMDIISVANLMANSILNEFSLEKKRAAEQPEPYCIAISTETPMRRLTRRVVRMLRL